jgi:hypothetical protein
MLKSIVLAGLLLVSGASYSIENIYYTHLKCGVSFMVTVGSLNDDGSLNFYLRSSMRPWDEPSMEKLLNTMPPHGKLAIRGLKPTTIDVCVVGGITINSIKETQDEIFQNQMGLIFLFKKHIMGELKNKNNPRFFEIVY